MRALLLAALLFPAVPAARAEEDEEIPPIQRSLVNLHLGDGLETVRRIYPPAQEWTFAVEPRGRVTRYKVERGWAKVFPSHVDILFLGFKKGRLVEIEAVYDQQRSRERAPEKLAGEYALTYGEARRSGDRFWWADGRTVLRVFPYELPVLRDGEKAVEWLTAVQVFEKGVFERTD